jgi:hypothetical protein
MKKIISLCILRQARKCAKKVESNFGRNSGGSRYAGDSESPHTRYHDHGAEDDACAHVSAPTARSLHYDEGVHALDAAQTQTLTESSQSAATGGCH